jgi:glycosyltransferase involved in cell wall biosynthesis
LFCFIIPLKNQELCNSWIRTGALLQRSLNSISQQTSNNFRIIIVANALPENVNLPSNCIFLKTYFNTPENNIDYKDCDKSIRIFYALTLARTIGAKFIMPVDADDVVSNKIVEFVELQPENINGWQVNSGYIYKEGSNIIYLRYKKFFEICGTSAIFNINNWQDFFFNVPQRTNPSKSYFRYNKDRSKTKLKSLPFPGAIYSIYNGENFFLNKSNIQKLKKQDNLFTFYTRKILKYFPLLLSEKISKEFTLYKV